MPYPNGDIFATTQAIVMGANNSIAAQEYVNHSTLIALLSLIYDLSDSETILLEQRVYAITGGMASAVQVRGRMIEEIFKIKEQRGTLHSN